jgi:DNA-binding LacI/PurR family transcriptional regulator
LLEGLKCSAVITDDLQVGVLATQHLIQLGHQKIGHLRGTKASTSLKRFQGYQQAIADAGLRSPASIARECGFTESDGYSAMKVWIQEGGVPPAIFAANDPAAIGAMSALNDSGIRVPDDVAIVGAGSIHYGDMLRVPLTTVSWSTIEMGQAAAKLLLESIDGKNNVKNRRIIVKPELVIRQSCGARKEKSATDAVS